MQGKIRDRGRRKYKIDRGRGKEGMGAGIRRKEGIEGQRGKEGMGKRKEEEKEQ